MHFLVSSVMCSGLYTCLICSHLHNVLYDGLSRSHTRCDYQRIFSSQPRIYACNALCTSTLQIASRRIPGDILQRCQKSLTMATRISATNPILIQH
ncbi:hypothetical protein EDC04DRAFT_420168 [Pisolithus marmoratus]|nr:hypothetical protein EDC04DRAFT_420168 [Pisolithus marmoratus]